MDSIGRIIDGFIKVEKKEIEPCLKQVDITIPADKVELGYNSLAKEIAKGAKISGFRPGKVPVHVVKSLYKKNIEEETVKELLSSAFKKASEDKTDDLLSYTFPDKKSPELKLGEDFKFSLRFNLAPKIDLPQYKGVKVELDKIETSNDDIDKRIDYFREIYGKFEKIDAPASDGDMLKVSYTSDFTISDDAKDSVKKLVSSESNFVWLNQNDIIPGINNVLKGKKSGEKIDHEATFAADYEEKELAGQKINYSIEILEVQHKVPIESDEELCSKLMIKSVDELKERLTQQAESELENNYKTIKKNKVTEILTQDLDFSVPPDMLKDFTANELNFLVESKMKNVDDKDKEAMQEELKNDKDKLMEEAKEIAIKKLKSFLLLRKIGKEEKMEVSDEEVDKHIQSMSHYYGYKAEELKKRLLDSGNISQVYDEVLINKVTDFIADNAEVEYIEVKQAEVVN